MATSDFAYFRFHGPKEMFASAYSDTELRNWAKKMIAFLETRRDVYAYFNNDAGGHAPRDSKALLQKLPSGNREPRIKIARKAILPRRQGGKNF